MRRTLVVSLAAAALLGGVGTAVLLAPAGSGLPEPAPTASPITQPSRAPLLAAVSDQAPIPTRAGLLRALREGLSDARLGELSASIVDVGSGRVLLDNGANRLVTPASTTKIVTAIAALRALGPDRRFVTKVVAGYGGAVVLVGGGDPTLAGEHARVGVKAAQLSALAAELKDRRIRRIVVDDSLFTGDRLGPGWKQGYVTAGDVAPVSALMVDEGRSSSGEGQPRVADPAMAAGRALGRLLGVPSVRSGRAPKGAKVLAEVSSPRVAVLVEQMLQRSDNDLAEALGRHVALKFDEEPSFAGETAALRRAVRSMLRARGLSAGAVSLEDASGLSRDDLIAPSALTTLLAVAATDVKYRPVLAGLPVAGFGGTLVDRFRSSAARSGAGVIRAKTGSLAGVSALAGLVVTQDGRLLAFAFVANDVAATSSAQVALDRLAAGLASCGCR